MRRTIPILLATLAGITGAIYSQLTHSRTVGKLEDGGFLLNTGWRIRPAGTNIPLSTLPMSYVPSPDGSRTAVLNGGYEPASVSLLDMETVRESSRVEISDGWRGLAFSPTGNKLYAGNGARGSLTEIAVDGPSLREERKIDLYPGEKPGTGGGQATAAPAVGPPTVDQQHVEHGYVSQRVDDAVAPAAALAGIAKKLEHHRCEHRVANAHREQI